ncbi:hypothetical protein SUGI_0195880 [Cryptomeria japonica]|nr:hypothetical protein SUGI_0195880 [Cryptomeria japonica]
MEAIGKTVNSELLMGNNSWQTTCSNDDHKSVLGLGKEEEINLFALKSGLSGFGEKIKELEQRSFQSKSHDKELQGNSAAITTSASILSKCQRLSFAGEEEVVEMEEVDILAEQRHLCSICGKEFRREGNVRIHMRSHGEQCKTLTSSRPKDRRSNYSCPFEGCRYNRCHPKFKHLKSMVSLRNHYKRSHCAKIYACNNCGKEFSFVGDLKSHGNKCGRSTWRCSCNLSLSTRNKLLHHVTLRHKPVPPAPVVGNATSNDETLELSAQELSSFAAQDSPILTESSPGCGSDENVLMMGVGSNNMEQNEYEYEKMENELSLSSEDRELYASVFWQSRDLLWP